MLDKLTDSKLISETVRLVKAEKRATAEVLTARRDFPNSPHFATKSKLRGLQDLARDPRGRGLDHIGQDLEEIYFRLIASPIDAKSVRSTGLGVTS